MFSSFWTLSNSKYAVRNVSGNAEQTQVAYIGVIFRSVRKEKIMKPFTSLAILFGASILAAWIAFQAFNGSSLKTHDVTHKMSNIHHAGDESVLPLIGVEARTVAPVYDASGALVSDPTSTIWNSDNP